MRFGAGSHRLGQVKVTVMGKGSLDAALAAHGKTNVLGMVLGVERGKHLVRGLGFVFRLEEALHVFFRKAGDSDLAQCVSGVDEKEEVAVAGIGARRRDVLGKRVIMELFVDDDPHVDVMPPHHVEDHRVALYQPGLAERDLLRPRGQVDGWLRRRRSNGGTGNAQQGEEGQEPTRMGFSVARGWSPRVDTESVFGGFPAARRSNRFSSVKGFGRSQEFRLARTIPIARRKVR